MKKKTVPLALLFPVLAIAAVVFILYGGPERSNHIYVLSLVEIEPIVQLRDGFESRLRNEFGKEMPPITHLNAQGDAQLYATVADEAVRARPQCIYVLGTPLAQAVQGKAPELLLIQGAVTDPVAAGLADGWEGSGRAYAATSDQPPMDKLVELIRDLSPAGNSWGTILNPSEPNSVSVVADLRNAAKIHGVELVQKPISTTADVSSALAALAGKCTVLVLPPDNTAHAALDLVGQWCRDNNVALYTTVSDSIGRGALAALALDYIELGKEAAELFLQVRSGADPGSLPIVRNRNPAIHISQERADALGVTISKLLAQSATIH